MDIDDTLMLPEAGLVIVSDGLHQIVAQRDAEEVQRPCQRRCPAAVHSKDEYRSGWLGGVLGSRSGEHEVVLGHHGASTK